MPLILKLLKDAPEYRPVADDTLASIAADRALCEPWVTWKIIARYNWGTDAPDEVVRAMAETVGIKIEGVFGRWGRLKAKPEEVRFDPDADLPGVIRLPKQADVAALALEKVNEVRVKRSKPAVGVAIDKLDPWFVPEAETCDIAYRLEGQDACATKTQIDIYGSNYTFCTDFEKGVGVYADPKPFDIVPLFTKSEGLSAAERGKQSFAWTGEVTTKDGMLQHKAEGQDKRHVNVAFSPYTVQVRYWKSDDDKTAQLQLLPFWPAFEDDAPVTHAGAPAYLPSQAAPTRIKVDYTNAEAIDFGVLSVRDAAGQLVHRQEMKDNQLEKGARSITWDCKYTTPARNGRFKPEYIADEPPTMTAQDVANKLLFQSTPYTFEVKTWTKAYKTGGDEDPSKIRFKLIDAAKVERGLVQVFDKKGRLVWLKAIPKAKLAGGKVQEIAWDGAYAQGLKNSLYDKDAPPAQPVPRHAVAIEADMPYRVQIQVHSKENVDEGLALAAMHSEVRLYVPKEQHGPKDPRRDLPETPQAMLLTRAAADPRAEPAAGQTARYYQHALNAAGFHAGPVSDVDNNHLKRALREFKRSVPANPNAAPGQFTRIPLTAIDSMDAAATGALQNMTDRYRRKIWGDRALIDGNSDTPWSAEDKINDLLGDPEKEIVLWADDRQYFTQGWIGIGPDNADFLTGNQGFYSNVAPPLANVEAAKARGMLDYRGPMAIGDTKIDLDRDEIPRPWAPLRVELRLLCKGEDLRPKAKDERIKMTDLALRGAMRRAIGPIRVDWSVHDAEYEVNTIDPAIYPIDTSQSVDRSIGTVRTRRFVAGQLFADKRAHKRADAYDEAMYWNCPKTPGDVGARPGNLALYHREVFGQGDDDSLRPWAAFHDDDAEATASIVHDHIVALGEEDAGKQKVHVNLIARNRGMAGIWINPSNVAGDGYRLRAEVKFKEKGDYKFPNLKVLAARYPVTPLAHSAEIRIWRRASFRGYLNWSSEQGNWGAGHINRVRTQYKLGHVYFVHEGADAMGTNARTAAQLFNVNDAGGDLASYRNILKFNSALEWINDEAKASFSTDYVWPWSHRADLGKPGYKKITSSANYNTDVKNYMDEWGAYWTRINTAIIFWIVKKFEEQGMMRGHLMADFADSPEISLWKIQCPNNPEHIWVKLKRRGTGGPPAMDCPECGAGHATNNTEYWYKSINLAAVAMGVGSTWLFLNAKGDTWGHEIGRHRHFEHAASGPLGAGTSWDRSALRARRHDTANNPGVGLATPSIYGADNSLERGWDRRCLMTYAVWDGGESLFCGKCTMRNRGWRITGMPDPAPDVREPS